MVVVLLRKALHGADVTIFEFEAVLGALTLDGLNGSKLKGPGLPKRDGDDPDVEPPPLEKLLVIGMPTYGHLPVFVEVKITAVRPSIWGHTTAAHDRLHDVFHPAGEDLRLDVDAPIAVRTTAPRGQHPRRLSRDWFATPRIQRLMPSGPTAYLLEELVQQIAWEWAPQVTREATELLVHQGVLPVASARLLLGLCFLLDELKACLFTARFTLRLLLRLLVPRSLGTFFDRLHPLGGIPFGKDLLHALHPAHWLLDTVPIYQHEALTLRELGMHPIANSSNGGQHFLNYLRMLHGQVIEEEHVGALQQAIRVPFFQSCLHFTDVLYELIAAGEALSCQDDGRSPSIASSRIWADFGLYFIALKALHHFGEAIVSQLYSCEWVLALGI
mmetsp:Transcript_61971/g.134313  ORF Transcript_61971/g.134313 Transcript_61971/m.134313 type:complete len:387 (-) Transcript_61971:411-1571(-)